MSGKSRLPVSAKSNAVTDEARVNEALDLMLQALKLLDRNQGPHDVCAHLDIAINRLQVSIDERGGAPGS